MRETKTPGRRVNDEPGRASKPAVVADSNARPHSTATWRPVAADDDLARVLAADLAAVFGREAPDVSLTALGQVIIREGRRREARP